MNKNDKKDKNGTSYWEVDSCQISGYK